MTQQRLVSKEFPTLTETQSVQELNSMHALRVDARLTRVSIAKIKNSPDPGHEIDVFTNDDK